MSVKDKADTVQKALFALEEALGPIDHPARREVYRLRAEFGGLIAIWGLPDWMPHERQFFVLLHWRNHLTPNVRRSELEKLLYEFVRADAPDKCISDDLRETWNALVFLPLPERERLVAKYLEWW